MMKNGLVIIFRVDGDVHTTISSSDKQHTVVTGRSESCEFIRDDRVAHVVPLGVQAVAYAVWVHLKGVH
jgi:hypothetical protein